MTEDGGRFIRPYAITGGRTRPEGREIPLETQIRTAGDPDAVRDRYRWEARRIVDLCRSPMALVELAARLEIPVGAVRIIVSDLAKEGVLEIRHEHEMMATADSSEYQALLERVLDGIRRL